MTPSRRSNVTSRPKISEHYSLIGINKALFARVDALWEQRDELNLTHEELRVLERHWKGFVKSGAKLSDSDQQRLVAIKSRLSTLKTSFGQNVLADEKDWLLELSGEDDLAGLPGFLRQAMAVAATDRGKDGKFVVTLSRSIVEPFLTFSERRDLREQAFNAWTARGANPGPTDNRGLIGEILHLRDEQARLLGYPTFADLQLDTTMAKTPETATTLMRTVWNARGQARGRRRG